MGRIDSGKTETAATFSPFANLKNMLEKKS
jgi:hypothetical protein